MRDYDRRRYPTFDQRYAMKHVVKALVARVTGLTQEVTASQNRIVFIALPAMTVLSPPNVQNITWKKPMPTDVYETYAVSDGILGTGNAVVSNRTKAGITITTTATGVIQLNTRVIVLAWTQP